MILFYIHCLSTVIHKYTYPQVSYNIDSPKEPVTKTKHTSFSYIVTKYDHIFTS